ncbi:hypothetical protein [Rhodovibrio sodomensis]|nr:hypothetical protein [Rhodovibrio sodomensis]
MQIDLTDQRVKSLVKSLRTRLPKDPGQRQTLDALAQALGYASYGALKSAMDASAHISAEAPDLIRCLDRTPTGDFNIGYWTWRQFKDVENSDEIKRVLGLETCHVILESDPGESADEFTRRLEEAYYSTNDIPPLTEWEPTPPHGQGWHLAGQYAIESGDHVALFVRTPEAAHAPAETLDPAALQALAENAQLTWWLDPAASNRTLKAEFLDPSGTLVEGVQGSTAEVCLAAANFLANMASDGLAAGVRLDGSRNALEVEDLMALPEPDVGTLSRPWFGYAKMPHAPADQRFFQTRFQLNDWRNTPGGADDEDAGPPLTVTCVYGGSGLLIRCESADRSIEQEVLLENTLGCAKLNVWTDVHADSDLIALLQRDRTVVMGSSATDGPPLRSIAYRSGTAEAVDDPKI